MNIQTEVVTLTPAMAEAFLKKNQANRPVSRSVVRTYAEAIKRGEWRLNGEPIVFSEDDALVNGQHRCKAVILANRAINTLTVRGVERETFATFDSGKKRNASDILGIEGHKCTVIATAGARAIIRMNGGVTSYKAVTVPQLLATVEAHPGIHNWSKLFAQSALRKFCSSAIVGILTIMEETSPEKALHFFNDVNTGIGLTADNPVLHLRNRLIDQGKGKRFTTDHQMALIIKAANAHARGAKMKMLRHGGNDEFPALLIGA